MDVAIVILGNLWRLNIIFRPSSFYTSRDLNYGLKRLRRFMNLHRRLRGRQAFVFDLSIDVYYVFILIELLYTWVLLLGLHTVHEVLFLVDSAVASRIIVQIFTLGLWFLCISVHSWAMWTLMHYIWGRVHWAFLMLFHKVGLVWDSHFVGLRSVV